MGCKANRYKVDRMSLWMYWRGVLESGEQEMIVDNFAGGGGASTGIEEATGYSVDVAINHDPDAIAMHRMNHPTTRHYCENVWEVNPREVAAGRPVGLVWFSPDCTHHSKARGGRPRKKNIRGLAWVAVRWAATVKPRVIMLENVEEFQTWGPLIPKRDLKTGRMLKIIPGKDEEPDKVVVSDPGEYVPSDQRYMIPDPKRKGRTFRSFIRALRQHGYEVEWRELRACDYGAPTTRKRFFLIARCDGQSIVWPEPTHLAADHPEVVSGKQKPWRSAAECIDWTIAMPSIFERKRPLAANTMRRIARGIDKFIFKVAESGEVPYIAPMVNITTNDHEALVTAFLAQYHTETGSEVRGQTLDAPLMTQDTSNRFALITSYLVKFRGKNTGQSLKDPLHTITAGGNHHGLVYAFLTSYYGKSIGGDLRDPLGTITTRDRFGLIIVKIKGIPYVITDICMRMLEPHELYAAQGFPKNYIIDGYLLDNGKPVPKFAQVARCGNSVPPQFAKALVSANLSHMCIGSGKRLTLERYAERMGQLQLSL